MSETRTHSDGQRNSIHAGTLWFCAGFSLLSALYPFTRAWFRVQIGYNEGWNIYNAQRVVQHLPLYPLAYGWRTVDYPMLSFVLLAYLHRFTNDYLFTARAVSLISLVLLCGLVMLIVRSLQASWRASTLSGLVCLALFCTDACPYVGMDDPQMLAQLFFVLGLLVYTVWRESTLGLVVVAAIFVLAGSIKHNPVDFPLAVLLDLLLAGSGRPAPLGFRISRAMVFLGSGIGCLALSIRLTILHGGPSYIAWMTAPRNWLVGKAFWLLIVVMGPLLAPLVLGAAAVWWPGSRSDRRVIGILLALSLLVGTAFGGGAGEWISVFLSAIVTLAITLGLLFDDLERGRWCFRSRFWASRRLATFVPAAAFGWLVIPALVAGVANPLYKLGQLPADQRRFNQEVSFLRQHPSPQICENLVLCFFAGKPYIYDPFNATRLIEFRKLDPTPMLDALRTRSYGAIELEQHEDPADGVQLERFSPAILDAILRNYHPALTNQDVVVYLPNFPRPLVADQQESRNAFKSHATAEMHPTRY